MQTSRSISSYSSVYELELNRWLRRLCRPGYTAYDVGGQLGYDALVLAKAPMVA